MILNLPTDIEKKVDHIIISLPFKDLTLQNYLKNKLPTENELAVSGRSLKIRVSPGDGSINFRQKSSNAGISWNYDFSMEVKESKVATFTNLNRFSNQKVMLIIGTSTHRYQLGWEEQPLEFDFRESLTGFQISFSGTAYYPAARKEIASFRSTF